MEEFVIFERVFEQESEKDSLYIKLTCDTDNETEYIHVKSISFTETLDSLFPMMVIDFIDGSGDFFNESRLDNEATYTLYYGRTIKEASETKFKVAEIRFSNATQGTSKNVHFKVVFLHKDWEKISAEQRNRAWYDTKYSDVIRDIVSTYEYNEVDIEDSDTNIENIIQANWSDDYMVKSIRESATPVSRDGHYEYCGTLDGRFFFKSTYELIKRGVERYKADDMVILKMGGQPSKAERDKMYQENKNVPISFGGIVNNEKYAEYVANGVTAVETSYFDWYSRAYVKSKHTLANLNATQLSERSLVREGVDFVSKFMFGGRDSTVVAEGVNLLSGMAISMQDISITIEGTIEVHPGDIVEVMIPNAVEFNKNPYNEMYSGFYMIREVQHNMTLNNLSDFVTSISLCRHGMDAKGMDKYVKSQKGRADFK